MKTSPLLALGIAVALLPGIVRWLGELMLWAERRWPLNDGKGA